MMNGVGCLMLLFALYGLVGAAIGAWNGKKDEAKELEQFGLWWAAVAALFFIAGKP